jgi:1-acyl-sn-glycerol-3-phosphate acyltransferase
VDDYRVPLRFRISRAILRAVFRGIFGVLGCVRISGREHVPTGKAYIVAMNHVSIFDPPFAAAYWPESLEIIGASDVFSKLGQGQLLWLYGVTPVHRGEYDRALLDWTTRVLKSGQPLLLAPEGGR